MFRLAIWHEQGTSEFDRRNVYALRYCANKRRIHAILNLLLSKLAKNFVFSLIEEKLSPLNFLYFALQVSLKDFGELKVLAILPNHARISLLIDNYVRLAEQRPKAWVEQPTKIRRPNQ